MRASATSRISHQASAHALQAAAHASKTDEASPFALLVASVSGAQRKDTGPDDDKQDEPKADAARAADSKAVAGTPAGSDKAAGSDKTAAVPGKPDAAEAGKKDDDKSDDKTAVAAGDASANAAALQSQAIPADAVPPAVIAPAVAASDAGTAVATKDKAVEQAGPVGQPGTSPAAPAPADPAQPQAGGQPAPKDQQASAASGQALTPAQDDLTTSKPAPPKGADTSDVQRGSKAADIKPARADTAQSDDAKPDVANRDGAKTDAKTAAKADATKADAAQLADLAKPAPPAANTNPAGASTAIANSLAGSVPAAPPALQTQAAPILAQHVEVKAQPPSPNLPALGIEIAARSQSGMRQFDIRLDPPELGRVEVRLSIDATGKASAHLSADQPQTLDLLQKDATGLTRALRDAGLNVSQDGLNFSLRQQASGGGQDHGGGRSTPRGARLSLHASNSIEPGGHVAAIRTPAHGRVDISV